MKIPGVLLGNRRGAALQGAMLGGDRRLPLVAAVDQRDCGHHQDDRGRDGCEPGAVGEARDEVPRERAAGCGERVRELRPHVVQVVAPGPGA